MRSLRAASAALALALCASCILLAGCSLGGGAKRAEPAQASSLASDDATILLARRSGLASLTVDAAGFELLKISKPARGDSRKLHIYLSGDGAPWRDRRVSKDPGPYVPVALQLMLRDPAAAVLLGRPCYHLSDERRNLSKRCNPSLWTFERYGESVLAALESALRTLLRTADVSEAAQITLVGYSGGGTLAVLLAQRVAAIDGVITIGAPLDVAAWTRFQSFTPLLGSMDPVQARISRPEVRELHLQGSLDRQVPPATTQAYFQKVNRQRSDVVQRVISSTDNHRCCWADRWPLPEIERWLEN